MSFLYNTNVFKKLVDSLKNESLIKNAADPVVANNADFAVAKALADQLYLELKSEKPQPEITAGNGDLELNVATIKNFGTFMQNLSDHQVMVDGVRLVYPMDPNKGGLTKEQATEKGLGIITTSPYGERDNSDRKYESNSFYVDAKALRAYLESLKQMAEGATAPEIVLPYVNTLILNFNRYFSDLKIDRAKKDVAGDKEVVSLTDNAVLDNINNYYVFPDSPLKNPINPLLIGVDNSGGMAPYPVRVKDVRTSGGFNSFAINCTVHDEDVGKLLGKRPAEASKLKCMLLNVLLARSEYYMNNAIDDNKKRVSIYYNNRIKSLMSEFSCEISAPGQEKRDKEEGKTPTGEKREKTGWLQYLSSPDNLPLSMSSINVQKIVKFVTEYNNFLAEHGKTVQSPVSSELARIQQTVSSINNMMLGGGAEGIIFNLSAQPVAFSTKLNGGIKTLAVFLNALKNLVQYTSDVTQHMEYYYGRELGDNVARLRNQHTVIVRNNMDILQAFIRDYGTPKRNK